MTTRGERQAAAWKEWLESESGRRCADQSTLGASERMREFLENRLAEAFSAGADVGERITRDGFLVAAVGSAMQERGELGKITEKTERLDVKLSALLRSPLLRIMSGRLQPPTRDGCVDSALADSELRAEAAAALVRAARAVWQVAEFAQDDPPLSRVVALIDQAREDLADACGILPFEAELAAELEDE